MSEKKQDVNSIRAAYAKQSLARWSHILSVVEPSRASDMLSHGSSDRTNERYSPSTNYLIEQNVPVPMSSTFQAKKFQTEGDRQTIPPKENPTKIEGSVMNPVSVTGHPTSETHSTQSVEMITDYSIASTLQSIIEVVRPESISQAQEGRERSIVSMPENFADLLQFS